MTTAEDRDTWERDEEANRRQATEAHAAALPATESDAEGARVVPDPDRVARYAKAAMEVLDASPLSAAMSHGYAFGVAQAVVAVADEERAPLVAEVERLRGEVKHWEHHAWEAGEGFKRAIEDGVRAGARRRAAEAKVAKVEALLALRESNNIRDEEGFVVVRADDVRAMIDPGPDHSCESNGEGACRHCGADEPPPWPTRAVLADAPAEQRAEGGA